MIHDQHTAAVFGLLASVLDDLNPAADYRRLFDVALENVRRGAGATSLFPPIDLPMAVADAMGLPVPEGLAGAAACTLVWAGADLMDDAADGQLPEEWKEESPHRIALVSTNLLSTLPHLLVGRFDPGSGSVSSQWSQALSRTLFTMSEGQWTDLDSARSVTTADAYLALVRRKTGAEFALFASTPAMLADADAATIGAWVRFGMAFGTMSQVFSDTVSTVAEGPRNDLLTGKRSLPVLHTLATLCDSEHARFVADLDSAAHGEEAAVARAIDAMTSSGAWSQSIKTVEVLRHRAFAAAPVDFSKGSACPSLRRLLESCKTI